MSNEQSIREELARELFEFEYEDHWNQLDDVQRRTSVWAEVASVVLESPTIGSIKAEALRGMAERVRREWFPHGCPWVGYLDDEASRIEKGMGSD